MAGLVQLERADVGVGAGRLRPRHAALVGGRRRRRVGPAQRRVVGRVAQRDGLGRPAIVGEPAREQQAGGDVLQVARGIALDVAAEDVVAVAVDVAADQEVAVGRGLEAELAGAGEEVAADEAEDLVACGPNPGVDRLQVNQILLYPREVEDLVIARAGGRAASG